MTSSNIVKCISCNIVINEVLAFVQNKHNVMDDVSLMRICVTGFSADEVEQAKKLLYDSLNCSEKYISRRKDKVERDIQDIIRLMKNTSTEKIPIFVAKDLHKLPPVNFENVDVTRLLKDIVNLQAEVRSIKENYATCKEIDLLKSEIQYLKSIETMEPLTNQETCININNRRGAFLLDSGPIGLSFNNSISNISALSPKTMSAVTDPDDDVIKSPPAQVIESTWVSVSLPQCSDKPSAAITEPVLGVCDAVPANKTTMKSDEHIFTDKNDLKYRSIVVKEGQFKKPYAQCIPAEGEWKDKKVDDEWKLVQNRRYRNKFIGKTGSANTTLNAKFRAADVKVPLFVSNVDKSVSESDIIDYIFEKTQERVSLSKIKMKIDKGYHSYKVFVSKFKLGTYLNDNLWPSGITFRRFIVFKSHTDLS